MPPFFGNVLPRIDYLSRGYCQRFHDGLPLCSFRDGQGARLGMGASFRVVCHVLDNVIADLEIELHHVTARPFKNARGSGAIHSSKIAVILCGTSLTGRIGPTWSYLAHRLFPSRWPATTWQVRRASSCGWRRIHSRTRNRPTRYPTVGASRVQTQGDFAPYFPRAT